MRRAFAATLLLAPLVHAAGEMPKKPVPPMGVQAMTAAMHEVQNVMLDGTDLVRNVDRLIDFRHSPETAKLLLDAFGNERPWSVEKRGAGQGRTDYRFLLAPIHTTTPGGNTLVWDTFPIDFGIGVGKAGTTLDYHGNWPSLSFEDKDTRLTMRDATLAGKQRRGLGDIWYGTMRGNVASMQLEHKAGQVSVSMRDLWIDGRVDERPRTVDMAYAFGIKSIDVAGERIDDFRMAVRFVNIEKGALVSMRAAERKMSAQTVAASEDLQALMPLLRQLVRGASRHKTALLVDEMSIGYRGHKASLKGRIGFGPGDDRVDMASIGRRIDARFTIRVPLALVREVATVVVSKQAAAANKPQAQPQDAAAMAASAADAIVGKMVGNGYARLENDALVSTIEIRGGVLRVNGKQVELPKSPKQPAPADAASYMQSRRISDSCTMPDYPAEVAAGDLPLELQLDYVVEPDGKLGEMRLSKASGFTDYDNAVLQAFKTCRFLPALRGDKPIHDYMRYMLKREPGSIRP